MVKSSCSNTRAKISAEEGSDDADYALTMITEGGMEKTFHDGNWWEVRDGVILINPPQDRCVNCAPCILKVLCSYRKEPKMSHCWMFDGGPVFSTFDPRITKSYHSHFLDYAPNGKLERKQGGRKRCLKNIYWQ